MLSILNGSDFSKEEIIGKASKDLKSIAKELDVPVIAISSLSRAGNLRGSNDLDYNADVIIHMRKPSNDDMKDRSHIHLDDRLLDITKQRNGETGVTVLRFIKEYQRFVDQSNIKTEFKSANKMPGTGGFHNPLPFTND